MIYQPWEKINDLVLRFEDESFQRFVRQFYYDSQATESELTIEELYKKIFSNSCIFKRFLEYCDKNGFNFIELWENQNIKKALALLKFEKIYRDFSTKVAHSVTEILWLCTPEDVLTYSREEIPYANITRLRSLLMSIIRELPINSRSEIVYHIQDFENTYDVYSEESWRHRIDKDGIVCWRTPDWYNGYGDTILQKISAYEEVLAVLIWRMPKTEKISDCLNMLINSYNKQTWNRDDSIKEWKIKFKLWISWEIVKLRRVFEKQVKISQKTSKIFLTWWTDYWDGRWPVAHPFDIESRSHLRIVN